MTEETRTSLLQGDTNDSGDTGSTEQATQPANNQDSGQQTDSGEQSTETSQQEDSVSEGAPETYSDFTLPEGMTANQPLLDAILPVFKELNLSQENAQKAISAYAAQIQAEGDAQNKMLDDLNAEWIKKAENHNDYGGSAFEENLKTSNGFIGKFFNPDAVQILKDSRVGNHPDIWAGMVSAGKHIQTLENKIKELTSEDQFIHGDRKPDDAKTTLDKRYPTMKD